MERNPETTLILQILAVIIGFLLLATVTFSFMSGGMMSHMMEGGSWDAFNIIGLVLIIIFAAIFLITIVLLLSPPRQRPSISPHSSERMTYNTPLIVSQTTEGSTFESLQMRDFRMQEATIVKMLDDDERQLYTVIREKGGEMLQKDIVASKAFSKAKVTRLLDKMEKKNIVIRERYGMTNKIRLVAIPPKAS